MTILLKDGRRYYINTMYGVETIGNDVVINSMEINNGVTIKHTIEIPEELIETYWSEI